MIGGIADEPYYLHICEDAGGYGGGWGHRHSRQPSLVEKIIVFEIASPLRSSQ